MSYSYTIIENEVSVIKSLEKFFKENHDYSCVGISSEYDESFDIILQQCLTMFWLLVIDFSQYSSIDTVLLLSIISIDHQSK